MHEKAYVCLKVGDKYSADYVNKLYSMVKQWDHNYTGPFFCYTEDARGINSDIQILPIPDKNAYEKWWFKLPLLVEPTLSVYDKKILFDLDVVIHGSLDFIDNIDATKLTICKAFWKSEKLLDDLREFNTLYNSSIMIWRNAQYVFDYFERNEDKYMLKYKGVDRFLHHEKIDVDTIPEGIVYSYRKGATIEDCRPFVYRKEYRIALFHQYPKQENLPHHQIVRDNWK